jgi:hypothetical protein
MKTKKSGSKSSSAASAEPKKRQFPGNWLRANLRDDRLLRFGIPSVFFAGFFFFLLLYIEPAVIDLSNGLNVYNYAVAMHAQEAFPDRPSFFADPSFRRLFILELTPEYLREIAGTPGGWNRFAVTLCIYACHFPFIGALVLTALSLFFSWIFMLYIQGICAIRPYILHYVPAFFILTICAWYEPGYGIFLLPVAGALAFAVAYHRFKPSGIIARVLLLSLFFWASWYFFWWGCLLFALCAIIHECFNRERGVASIVVASAINSVLFFMLDAWVMPLSMTIRWNDFWVPRGQPLVMIGFFPIAAAVFAIWCRLRHVTQGKTTWNGVIVRSSILACGAVALVVWLCGDPVNRDTRTIARTVYHVMNGKWEAVLNEKTGPLFADFPQKTGGIQAFMVHAVDHALCRTGRIGDRLFSYPQKVFSYDPLLMLQTTLNSSGYVNWVVVLALTMDLGMVTTAEKIAGEVMENMGPYPDIMYRRALLQIANDNREAAAVYLNKLAHMPFYRAEAKRLLSVLGNNAALVSDPRIAALRAYRDTVDYYLFTVSYDAMLKNLLQSNPGNKAAYDYLMSYCLLTGLLDGVAVLSPAAPAFGYGVLPRHWDEALCVYQAATLPPSSEPVFSGVRRETVDRFNEFARAYSSLSDDPAAAAKLASAFGDSYFFFSIFKYSPGARHE